MVEEFGEKSQYDRLTLYVPNTVVSYSTCSKLALGIKKNGTHEDGGNIEKERQL